MPNKGKTVSEPIAIPAEPGSAPVKRLIMDKSRFDYVKVEPRPPGWKGAWRGPGDYRNMGYGIVPIQNRDDVDVELVYPGYTMTDSKGRAFEVPQCVELLHPELVLMARPKDIGDRERAKEEARNNPRQIETGDVRMTDLQSRDGVLARERKSVDLRDLEEQLPSEAEIQSEGSRRERAKDANPAFADALTQAANNNVAE